MISRIFSSVQAALPNKTQNQTTPTFTIEFPKDEFIAMNRVAFKGDQSDKAYTNKIKNLIEAADKDGCSYELIINPEKFCKTASKTANDAFKNNRESRRYLNTLSDILCTPPRNIIEENLDSIITLPPRVQVYVLRHHGIDNIDLDGEMIVNTLKTREDLHPYTKEYLIELADTIIPQQNRENKIEIGKAFNLLVDLYKIKEELNGIQHNEPFSEFQPNKPEHITPIIIPVEDGTNPFELIQFILGSMGMVIAPDEDKIEPKSGEIAHLFGDADREYEPQELYDFLDKIAGNNDYTTLIDIISDEKLQNRESTAFAGKTLKSMYIDFMESDASKASKLKELANTKIEDLAIKADKSKYSADLLEFKLSILKKAIEEV